MIRKDFLTQGTGMMAADGANSFSLAFDNAAPKPILPTNVLNVKADGITVFYREAGILRHPLFCCCTAFRHPRSSIELIPRLADRYRVIAPDLPGFGFTEIPAERHYKYTIAALAQTILAFTDALGLKRYALYVFDLWDFAWRWNILSV